jgi:hypothetical protein
MLSPHGRISCCFLLFATTLLSCNQTPETIKSNEYDSSKLPARGDTLSLDRAAENIRQTDFAAGKFVTLTESLLTDIQRKPVSLTYVVDTITAMKVNKGNYFFRALFSSASDVIKRYTFDAGKGNRELQIWFVEVTYPDTASAIKTFKELRRQANGAEDEQNYIPGLTYSNDYVIRSYKKIFWLNSGCPYSFTNHKKFAEYMLESLQVDKIHDSIWCECGEVKCN